MQCDIFHSTANCSQIFNLSSANEVNNLKIIYLVIFIFWITTVFVPTNFERKQLQIFHGIFHFFEVTLSTLSSGVEIRISYVYYHLRNCTLFNGVHFSRIQNCRMRRNKLLAVRFKKYVRVETQGRARSEKTPAIPKNS